MWPEHAAVIDLELKRVARAATHLHNTILMSLNGKKEEMRLSRRWMDTSGMQRDTPTCVKALES